MKSAAALSSASGYNSSRLRVCIEATGRIFAEPSRQENELTSTTCRVFSFR